MAAQVSYFADFALAGVMESRPNSECTVKGVEESEVSGSFRSDRAYPMRAESELGLNVKLLAGIMHLLQRNV